MPKKKSKSVASGPSVPVDSAVPAADRESAAENESTAAPSGVRRWIVVEAWAESREKNKRLIADAITGLILALCSTISGYAIRLAPGMNTAWVERFEEYHVYVLISLWACFNLFLFVELSVVSIKRIIALVKE